MAMNSELYSVRLQCQQAHREVPYNSLNPGGINRAKLVEPLIDIPVNHTAVML